MKCSTTRKACARLSISNLNDKVGPTEKFFAMSSVGGKSRRGRCEPSFDYPNSVVVDEPLLGIAVALLGFSPTHPSDAAGINMSL